MRLQDLELTLRDLDLGSIDAEADKRLDEYFVTTPYVSSALYGRGTLFLGRKGSGKSALFGHLPQLLVSNDLYETIMIPMTPDQYAWAALKEYHEQGLLDEQAHANAWKLTITIELAAEVVAAERDWTPAARESVALLKAFVGQNFGPNHVVARGTMSSVLKGLKHFNFSAFGFGMGVSRDGSGSDRQPLTPAILSALVDVLRTPLAESGFLIALDRLDDSWDGSEDSRSLLVGLLKATKELNDTFGLTQAGHGLRVLAFLRSDIYDALRFDDKDKHRPTEVHITWQSSELKEMLQRRLPEGATVDELFEQGDMRGSILPFNYMVKRTFLRPREILQFVDVLIQDALPQASLVEKDLIRSAEERYSAWKVDDLKQEYAKVFPDFAKLLECLQQERHRYDSIGTLELLIGRKEPKLIQEHGARTLVKVLFDASVIGIRLGNAGSARFKCEDGSLALPTFGDVYVHQSLHRGLRIREARLGMRSDAGARADHSTITVELQKLMMGALAIWDLNFWGLNPAPLDILDHVTFEACAASLGATPVVDDTITSLEKPDRMTAARLESDRKNYKQLLADMLTALKGYGLTADGYRREERRSRAEEEDAEN